MIGLSTAYAPAAFSGLQVSIAPGQIVSGGTVLRTPPTLIFLEPNVTSYIYLNLSYGVIGLNNSGYPAGEMPICIVSTDGQKILMIQDDRPDFSDAVASTNPNFADAEVPSGSIDGSNVTFSLENAPNPPLSLRQTQNGLTLQQGVDYELNDQTITFAEPPLTGDTLLAWYRY